MGEALFYAFFVGIGFGIYYDILRLFRLTAVTTTAFSADSSFIMGAL